MQVNRARALTAIIAVGAVWYGVAIRSAQAQQSQAAPAAPASNDLQRSVEVFSYNAAAKSGATRGEVIYYYKCWNLPQRLYDRGRLAGADAQRASSARTSCVTGDPGQRRDRRQADPQRQPADAVLRHLPQGQRHRRPPRLSARRCCYEETNPPVNPWYRATAQNSPEMPLRGNLRGGPSGTVRSAGGDKLEGIMVQLIAPNAVRTTVTTNRVRAIRIPEAARPAPTPCASPSRCSSCPTSGTACRSTAATEARRHRAAARAPTTDFLPPTTDILSQLTGAEWLWNLPGTAEEK